MPNMFEGFDPNQFGGEQFPCCPQKPMPMCCPVQHCHMHCCPHHCMHAKFMKMQMELQMKWGSFGG